MSTSNTVSAEHSKAVRKEIVRVTVILTILTLVELVLGFVMSAMRPESLAHEFIRGVIVILMIAKAFYIVAYFMHLKHEWKAMILTIVLPLALFVWFILVFLIEGNSYRKSRDRRDYDPNNVSSSYIYTLPHSEI